MTTRTELMDRSPRNNSSPAGRRADRERAQASGLEEVRLESRRRQEKSERLKQLRLKRDGEAT
ncbi:MAG: hypothetical protein VX640_13120 [Pseudomonadota bacterium]|nr:hypothetical protein [Pseudomonadota bacterium]